MDTTRTDVSLPISTQQIEDLPLNGRDFVNLAYLAPGARPVNSYDPTKNRIGVFAVDGSSGRNVNVTVNGIDDKDNTVGFHNLVLQLEPVEWRGTMAGCRVIEHQHVDATLTFIFGTCRVGHCSAQGCS